MIEKTGHSFNWKIASSVSFPTLADNQLHIWCLPLRLDPWQRQQALSILSDIQRDKYHRRATTELQEIYLAGRFYLLNLLGAYTKQSPKEVLLSYNRLNKPSLSVKTRGIEFNFTDTDGYGAFAFSKHRQVGIDIEMVTRDANFDAIAKRRFTSTELEFVYQNGILNKRRFLAIWTRKEAYGKARGVGINYQMNARNLYSKNGDLSTENNEHLFSDNHDTPWRCLQFYFEDSFIASVVHEGHQKLDIQAYKSFRL